MRKLFYYAFAVAATFTAGYASASLDDTILHNTSRTLGLETNEVTISDQSRNGITIDYIATTKDGRRFGCYVTSTFGIVSDAICTEKRHSGTRTTTSNNKSGACNELLRRAGKCE